MPIVIDMQPSFDSAAQDASKKRLDTILVVDDNAANRLLAEAILASGGYSVELADSGPKALASFEANPPALVLLDVLMPGMDGFETLRRLRALPRGPETPIMIVTALTDLSAVQQAIEAGADDFVSKPINRTELLVRIWTLLGARRLREDRAPDAEAELADFDQKQRELTSLLVHDLKHPLTTVYFNAGILARDASLPPKVQEKIRRILRAGETLDGMISSILDVTCSEDGSLKLHRTDFSVDELLAEVAATMEAQAEANRQRIEVFPNGVSRVHADRDLLRRVLENLVDNATKYAPPGSAIQLEVKGQEEWVEFRVHDRGPGIPAAHRKRLFQKYFQIDPDAKRSRRGHGLGLTLVRVAAEAHGGSVTVEDEPGGGSCFCVRVPKTARA